MHEFVGGLDLGVREDSRMTLGFWTAQCKDSWGWSGQPEEQIWRVGKFLMSTRHLHGEAKRAVG